MLARLRRVPFAAQVLLALVLGVALGLVAREIGPVADGTPNWLTSTLQTIGGTFVTLLKVLVPPLIVTAVIVSIANLKQVSNAARLAGQTLLWFAITALIAVAIGIGLGLLTEPGRNSSVDAAAAAAPENDRLAGWTSSPGWCPATSSACRARPTGALSFNVLQLIVIAVAIGVAALKVGEPAEPFLGFVRSALAIVQKVLWWVILLAPIGTLGLIGNAVASYGWESLGSLGVFTGAVYAGLALVLFVVYPVLLRAARALAAALLRRRLAGHPAGLRLPLLDRHAAGDRAGDRAEPGRPAVLRLVRRPARVRRRRWTAAPRSTRRWRRSSWPSSSASTSDHRLPADRAGLRRRLGGHRRGHRRGGHADADPVHARSPAGRCRPAPGDRPDPRHGPHRGERRGPGAGADDRRQARGHPRRRALPVGVARPTRSRAVEENGGVDADLRQPATV